MKNFGVIAQGILNIAWILLAIAAFIKFLTL